MAMTDDFRAGYIRALYELQNILHDRSAILAKRTIIGKGGIGFICSVANAMIENPDDVISHGSRGIDLVRYKGGKYSIRPKE